MRFPVYRWLRGVVFVDAGNVFPLISDVRIQDLVGSTGSAFAWSRRSRCSGSITEERSGTGPRMIQGESLFGNRLARGSSFF